MNNQQTESFTQTRRRIMSDADNNGLRNLSKESRNFFQRICQDYKGQIRGFGKWCSDPESETDACKPSSQNKDTAKCAKNPTIER